MQLVYGVRLPNCSATTSGDTSRSLMRCATFEASRRSWRSNTPTTPGAARCIEVPRLAEETALLVEHEISAGCAAQPMHGPNAFFCDIDVASCWLKLLASIMSAALYDEVAKEAGVPVGETKKVLKSFSGVVGRRLKAEGSLKLPNLAKIIVKTKKAVPPRQMVVFRETMQIDRQPAKKQLKFFAAKPLMDAVD